MATIETNASSAPSTSAQGNSQLDAALEKGKEYLDSAVTAAKDNPWTAAAVGAGVVAAAAATAYGATKLATRPNSGGKPKSKT
jgi:hypothetical protein